VEYVFGPTVYSFDSALGATVMLFTLKSPLYHSVELALAPAALARKPMAAMAAPSNTGRVCRIVLIVEFTLGMQLAGNANATILNERYACVEALWFEFNIRAPIAPAQAPPGNL
jgi:hypothetical protein